LTRCFIILIILIINSAVFADGTELRGVPRNQRDLTARRGSQIPNEIENDVLSREEQLIFGLTILNRRISVLGEDSYAHFLQELLNITRFSLQEAEAIMVRFRNNPENYLSVLEKIKQNLASNQ